jgi:mycothiol system anti-sigma-R factor
MSDHDDHDHGGDDDADCSEAIEALYTFLDGELTDTRRIEIRHHLDDCSPCLEAFDFEAELRRVVARGCREQAPDSLRAKVLDALRACEGEVDPA